MSNQDETHQHYWETIEKVAKEVNKWPEWKKGGVILPSPKETFQTESQTKERYEG